MRGKYGKTPGPISEDLKKLVLKKGEEPRQDQTAPMTHPPAKWKRCDESDLAAKGYPNATVEDVLSCALFLKWPWPIQNNNKIKIRR